MVSLADSLVASSSRPLGLRMRADLTARRHKYQGRVYWVVKEPIGLRYFRFQEEEFAVLNMMKGNVSLEEIKERFEDEFAPHKITYQDLQHFIGTLHRSGLVLSDSPGQGQQLKKRRDERTQKETLSKLSNVLAIRFKGIDPERILQLLYPFTRWLFSPTAFAFFIALAISALLLLGVQFDVFRSRLPGFDQFFGPKNWGYLAIVLGVTKIIHEFGHGLLCHHHGGECHEMGVMFLVLTPCLYCNVSDSWMLPSKWHRAAIGAGGIYFELIMASIATFVWWFSEPGMLNHLALRVMFICSVSTVIFNGNPLLRFDGYYILSDLIEIPNLRQKASKILQNKAAEYCLGLEMPEDPFLPQSNQAMFGLYTVAAVAYRWFIFFSILFFLNKVFEPYGLKVLGQLIALMGLFGLVVQPAWQGAKFLHVPGRMDQVKWPRLYATLAIVAAVISGIFCLPVPKSVHCAFQLQPREVRKVFADVPGRIVEVDKEPGQVVEVGETIAVMENDKLKQELYRLQAEVQILDEELEGLYKLRADDPTVDSLIPDKLATRAAKKKLLDARVEDYRKLTIKAPASGMLFSAQLRPEKTPPEGELITWTGSPLDPRNRGVFMEVSSVICQVGGVGEFEAVLAVDQADVNFIEVGSRVKMVLDSVTHKTIEGEVEEIAPQEMSEVPMALGNKAGGDLATRMDASGTERPLSATYRVIVPIQDPEGMYRDGYRGRARVLAGYQTLGSRLLQYFTRTFHFYM